MTEQHSISNCYGKYSTSISHILFPLPNHQKFPDR